MPASPLPLSFRHLNALVVLAELQSFTRAAARCHLSQPAFSALIRSLEETLGARLFDRDSRRVTLTAEGEAFVEDARRLLADFGSAVDGLHDQLQRRRGRVRIALLPALAAGWLPPVLAAFRREHPGIELDVDDVLSEDCIERVRSGRADFALAAAGSASPELVTERFCTDRFHLVCRRDHRLARGPAPRLEQLASEPFVHLARNSSVRQVIEQSTFPRPLAGVMELEQLATVAGMVRAGLGVTVVPSLTLFHFRDPELVTRPLAEPGLLREIFVVRRRGHSLSAAARALLEALEAQRPAPLTAPRSSRRGSPSPT